MIDKKAVWVDGQLVRLKKVKAFAGVSKDRCFLCREYFVPGTVKARHMHHMIHGTAGRTLATRYGLIIPLCERCHDVLHRTGENDLAIEQLAQEEFEKVNGHAAWMAVFGKDYRAGRGL